MPGGKAGYAAWVTSVYSYLPKHRESMSPSTPPTCNHDRGRGTTVCLRCRHEEAQATAKKRQRFFMQFLGLVSVAGVLAIAGVSAASTLRNRPTSETTSEGTVVAEPARATTTRSTPKEAEPKVAPVVQQAAEPPAPAPADSIRAPEPAPAAAAPHGGFVLVEGRTQLSDSVYAIRTGDSVIVNFDAFGFRTRRSTKIEQSLRQTLPLVFGKTATASVDTMAAGAFVTERDVVGALARDGMRVKLDNGAIAHIRVLTRIVSDGPIAIGYLATIQR
jgi:hypothetical protein